MTENARKQKVGRLYQTILEPSEDFEEQKEAFDTLKDDDIVEFDICKQGNGDMKISDSGAFRVGEKEYNNSVRIDQENKKIRLNRNLGPYHGFCEIKIKRLLRNPERHISSILRDNLLEIGRKVLQPDSSPGEFDVWVSGNLKSEKISLSSVMSGTTPNPDAWKSGDWLVKYGVVTNVKEWTKEELLEVEYAPDIVLENIQEDIEKTAKCARIF